jgi:hypothetical protein
MTRARVNPDSSPMSAPQLLALREQMTQELEQSRMKRSWHLDPPDSYAGNLEILSWWEEEYDSVIVELIDEFGRAWHQYATPRLLEVIPENTISRWRAADPICEQYAYYNVLTNFAVARARTIGLERGMPADEVLECRACGRPFATSSLKGWMWRDLGTDFCGACVGRAFWIDGDPVASRDEVKQFVRDIVEVWGRVPPQLVVLRDLVGTPRESRSPLIQVLWRRPTRERVVELFGSWFHALVEAGVLDGGAQRMGMGIRCLANDGHVCLSLGEKTIDDVMFAAEIAHEKEPSYPVGRLRADFRVGDTLVEYFGLAGIASYDEKIEKKRNICAQHSIPLLEIFPADLVDLRALEERLRQAAALP